MITAFQFSPSAILYRSVRFIRSFFVALADLSFSLVIFFSFLNRNSIFREFQFESDVRRMPGPQKPKLKVTVKGELVYFTVEKKNRVVLDE